MNDAHKTKEQLLNELAEMRRRMSELEQSETNHKRAVDALRESESKFRSTLQSVGDLVFVFDQDNRFVSIYSPEDKLYLPPKEFLGKTHAEVMPAHIDKLFSAALPEVKQGKTAGYEYQLEMPDGPRWYSVKLSALMEGEEYTGLVSVARDITERVQVDKALRESEEKFRTLIVSSPVGMFLDDAQGNAIYINEKCAELIGVPAEEVLNLDWVTAIHPDDRERVTSEWAQTVMNGEEFHLEYRWVHADGKVVWTLGDIVPARGNDGEITVYIGTLTDITERVQAEEKLNKANRLYATLSQVNQTIVRERDKQKIFQKICDVAIEFGKFRLAWIGLVDEENKFVKPVAVSGEGSDYLQNIEISLTDKLTGKGPTGRAIRERKSVVFNDLEKNPDFAPWREQALEKGYRSSAAFPIRLDNVVIGTLNVYAVEPHFFDEDEINLLEEAAMDISFALGKFEEEERRKRAEEGLQEHRDENIKLAIIAKERGELQDWINTFDTFVGKFDPNGVGIIFNGAPIRAGGVTRDEVVDEYFPDTKWWSHSEIERVRIVECFERAKAGLSSRIETNFRNADGTPIPIIFNCQPVLDEGGKIKYITAEGKTIIEEARLRTELEEAKEALETRVRERTSELVETNIELEKEIAERKRAEEALRASEEQFRTLFESSPIGIGVADQRGNLLLCNEAMLHDGGYSTEDIQEIGNVSKIYHKPDQREEALKRFREQGFLKVFQVQFKRKDGSHYDALLSLTPIHFKGQPCVQAIVEDITERVQAEQAIQQYIRRLDALHKIDRAITGSLDLKITLNILLDHLLTQLEVDAAAVLRYTKTLQALTFSHGKGFRTTAFQHTDLRLGQGYAGEVALQRHPVFIPDLPQSQTGIVAFPDFKDEGFVAYYGVPLIAKGVLVGVLEIFHRSALNPKNEWVDYLQTLAGQAAIAIDNITLFNDLQYSNMRLSQAYDATIEGWAQALELRDMETEGHSRRVVKITMDLAQRLEIGEEGLANIRRGALLHDIGKMGVPDAILQKPGSLTEEEWQVMRQHPVYAYEWLSSIEYLRSALDIPYCHHEKWDGAGYPRGLKGEQIPLAARIFAIVDVWDALLSDRPYRKAWSKEKVLAYIQEQSGKHFDPQVVAVFLEQIRSQ